MLHNLFLASLLAAPSMAFRKHKGEPGVRPPKTDSHLRMYAFNTPTCDGVPAGGNLDMKQGQCIGIPAGAHSVKPIYNYKHPIWVEEVNLGPTVCQLQVFRTPGCVEGEQMAFVPLPDNILKCVDPGYPELIMSTKFECGIPAPPAFSMLGTRTTVKTVWTMGLNDAPTPFLQTTVLTDPYINFANKRTAAPEPTKVPGLRNGPEPRVVIEPSNVPELPKAPAAQKASEMQPRGFDKDVKGVWMLHPWAMSTMCYECFRYNDNTADYKCKGGGKDQAIDCGTPPAGVFIDSNTMAMASNDTNPLERRFDWFRHVTFDNPYLPGVRTCARAEWEKRGQVTSYIKLEKIRNDMSDSICSRSQSFNLDVPRDLS